MRRSNDNRGGINAIVAVRALDVLGWATTQICGTHYSVPGIREGARKIVIPVLDNGGYNFREVEEITPYGELYHVTVTGKMKRSPETEELINTLRGEGWVVFHRDNDGRCYASGTRLVPMTFTCVGDTGNRTADLNAISFTFDSVNKSASRMCQDHTLQSMLV